jgi:glutathione synthase/RimK-type ligase-like ATP-grasp enzyme
MSTPLPLGVWVPIWRAGAPASPQQRPMGRVVEALEKQGVSLIFGTEVVSGQMAGWTVEKGGWTQAPLQTVSAIYDRFPAQSRAEAYLDSVQQLRGVPLLNPPSFTALCRDKWELQRLLTDNGVEMPAVAHQPDCFSQALAEWGDAFLKPRHGSFGRGVVRVSSEADLQAGLAAMTTEFGAEAILQQAVRPPAEWAGICLRVLVQRDRTGWVFNPGVARCSTVDPVVNAARGATVLPVEDVLRAEGAAALDSLLTQVCAVIDTLPDAEHVVEVGVDLVLTETGLPSLIELNGRPRGRLSVLAKRWPGRFQAAHQAAILRPFEYMAMVLPERVG